MSASKERDLIVGGQAVIEGVMMRTPHAYAVAVRRFDGSVVHTAAPLSTWSDNYPLLKLPVLRGTAVLVQSTILGIRALSYSAGAAFADEQKEGATAQVEAELNSPAVNSILFALFFNILLFIIAPLLLTNALYIAAGWEGPAATATTATTAAARVQLTVTAPDAAVMAPAARGESWYRRAYDGAGKYLRPVRPSIGFNLMDGMIRMAFFLAMIVTFSLMRDIGRVFEYHGAEHKTVFAWEAGLPLTIEHARAQPRQHPRCGTSFLMVVMLVSMVLFAFIRFDALVSNLLVRIALVPVVAGVAYEVIRLSAKREGSRLFKFITLPGLRLQNITTREPDDQQLEVAILALKESLRLEPHLTTVPAAAPLA